MTDPGLQRFLLKAMLSLPAPLLRVLAGGGVVYRGGRTLDPRFQYIWKAWRKPRPLTEMSPEEAREGWSTLVKTTGPSVATSVRVESLTIDGPGGPIPARLYRPPVQDPEAPLMVFFHEGGGVAGDLDVSEGVCTQLAIIARCAVLAPAYRLAPEHRFPAGLEDALATYRWARDNALALGAQQGCVAVGGQTMGGGFAAAICQMLKQAGEPQPALQLLVCPILDAASDSQSMRTYADVWPLSRDGLNWILGQYLGPEDDPSDPRLSPFRAEDVAELAPALIVTAGFDPLVDQGELYARKLKTQGTPVVYRCYDGLVHGFPAFAGVVPCAEVACREIAGLFREGVEGRVPGACAVRDRTEDARSLVL